MTAIQSTTGKYIPPFERKYSIFISGTETLETGQFKAVPPVTYQRRGQRPGSLFMERLHPARESSLRAYLSNEVDVTRLNKIQKHLWLAGLPRIGRPLHEQVAKGRRIVITEYADCHLVWQKNTILVKPMPQLLMDHAIWTDHICHEPQIFEAASGFLLSYLWIICYESDLKIAHETGLLSQSVDWSAWTNFTGSLMDRISYNELRHINPRYLYGELRMDRLNFIYRWCSVTSGSTTFVRGYTYGYSTYSSFIQKHTAWFLVVIVYITIVLTAMQVGLATHQLQDNRAFNRASYGFTIFSILAPLILLVVMVFVTLCLILFNLLYTLRQQRSSQYRYSEVFQRELGQMINH